MPEHAKNQPAGFKNAVERVAIISAGGNIGSHLVAALLKTDKHTVTILSRKDSSNKLPEGVLVARMDYDDEASIVATLQGQQFCIITMTPTAPRDTHSKLVQAGAKTGVPHIMPNGFAGDIEQIKLEQDIMLGPVDKANRDEIERFGMQWITVCYGFWYDYNLAGDDPSDCSAKAQNKLLDLPEESLDEATQVGIDLVKELQSRPERMAS